MNKKNGFTLLEIAIVLLIAGIFLAIGTMAYDLYSKNQKYSQTWKKMETIRNAIAEYQIKMKTFPCPADPTRPPGDPQYGVQNCNIGGVFTAPSSRDADGDPGTAENVLYGAVPVTTLINVLYPDGETQSKLSVNDIHDGWGNQIMYVMSDRLGPNFTFQPAMGAVDIIDENGLPLLDTPGSAHYALVSYGEDGMGAYSRNGTRVSACTPGLAETPNCVMGNTLVSGLLTLAAGPNYYDDLIQYVTWTAASMWTYVEGNPDDVYNTALGFVGMGLDTPSSALDVGGRIETTGLYTRAFCDESGNNCYSPEKIGSNDPTMTCDDSTMAVKQIGVNAAGSNASLDPAQPSVGCEKPFPSAAALNGSCPPGKYMYGYTTRNGGEPLCN